MLSAINIIVTVCLTHVGIECESTESTQHNAFASRMWGLNTILVHENSPRRTVCLTHVGIEFIPAG